MTYDEIMAYIKTVDSNEKVSEQEYEERIKHCKECDYLISGMCRKCGCYVEIRARMKNTVCPNYDDRKW